MMRLRHWQGAAVVLACCGLLLPQHAVQADVTAAKSQTPQIRAADVALAPSGALQGRVFTPNGRLVDGATVTILQGDEIVASTNTNDKGFYEVPQLKAGMYQVVVANHGAPVRVWSAETAPPSAKMQADLVVGQVVRGQSCQNGCPDGACECGGGGAFFGLDVITLVTLGAAVTAAVLAGINQKDLDDLDKKVDQLISP